MDSLKPITLIAIILSLLTCLPFPTYADQEFRLRAHVEEQNSLVTNDVRAEINFGRNVAARILGRYRLANDEQLNRYVNLVGKATALNSNRTEIDYYFAVLDTSHVNAYSAPGGYIFITSGALSRMEDEAELAAVLAHEIAHITEKHIVKDLNIRASDTSVAASLGRIVGGSSATAETAFAQAVDKAVEILFEKGFQQQDELDSDTISVQLLTTTGYDPTALARYLARLQQTLHEIPDEAASTHPPTEARLNHLASLIEAENLDALNFPKLSDRFKKYVTQSH
jgi:predicted Zn-dependent protease